MTSIGNGRPDVIASTDAPDDGPVAPVGDVVEGGGVEDVVVCVGAAAGATGQHEQKCENMKIP